MGNMPAMPAAKSVMASAKRLMEVRQRCRNNNRMAEINVPAWPMPIHHTKFARANPQATGMLTPNRPTPTVNSQVLAPRNITTPEKETIKAVRERQCCDQPQVHPSRPCRTRSAILSVMVAWVHPGPSTELATDTSGSIGGLSMSASLSVHPRQPGGSWSRIQFIQDAIIPGRFLAQADPAVRIIDITKNNGFRRTDSLTRSHHISIPNGRAMLFRFNPGP